VLKILLLKEKEEFDMRLKVPYQYQEGYLQYNSASFAFKDE
jgi:hypothetical protein